MFTLDVRRLSGEMAASARAMAPSIQDWTEEATLARDLHRPQATFHLLAPSESHPGQWYEVRVVTGAKFWTADHYGAGCLASMMGRPCKHIWAAALYVAQYAGGGRRFGGKIPLPERPKLTPAQVVSRRTVPPDAAAGFYD